MISIKPNVSLGIVDCSFYAHRIALKNDYHKKRKNAPLDFNYLEALARTFIIPPRQNQFIQDFNFNKAPVRPIAIALNTNSAFTGSYTERFSWYQQFDVRQVRIFRRGQPIVHFDAAGNCCLHFLQ